MEKKPFIYAMVGLAVLVVLCSLPFPGAMIGFFCGITLAWFVYPLAWLAHAGLGAMGMEATLQEIGCGFVVLYALCVLGCAAYLAYYSIRGGDRCVVRATALTLAVFAALPAMLYLSMEALKQAWH